MSTENADRMRALAAFNRAMLRRQQAGFSLMDVLIAMLLFSISILGLLKYQQVLTAQAAHYSDNQYAWRIAAQALTIYPALIEHEATLQNAAWQMHLHATPGDNGCQIITAQVTGPRNIVVQLQKWFCE